MIARVEPLVLVPGLLCTADLFAAQVAALGAARPVSIADHTTADNLPDIARSILNNAPPRFALAACRGLHRLRDNAPGKSS
jgi:hypothetical protein